MKKLIALLIGVSTVLSAAAMPLTSSALTFPETETMKYEAAEEEELEVVETNTTKDLFTYDVLGKYAMDDDGVEYVKS